MPSEQQISWGIEQLLDNLAGATLVLSRREAARELGTLTESNERIVRALLDARDSDDDGEVRREAARSLTAAPHREILRRNIALAMRMTRMEEGESRVLFEAWESGADQPSGAERWIVELTDAEAAFTKEAGRQKIAISGGEARQRIAVPGPPPAAGEEAGKPDERMIVVVEGRNLAISRTGYGKLLDWMEKHTDRPKAVPRAAGIPLGGIVLLALGGVQIVAGEGFSPFWGAVFLVLGVLNLFLPARRMVFFNALGLMAGGLWYILFAGPGYGLLGYLPAVWGTLKIIDLFRGR
jgi:hypothetical protein